MTQLVENIIIRRLVGDLLKAGATISVQDGEEVVLQRSTKKHDILGAMQTTDEDRLFVHIPDKPASFVYLIYGNGEDVISDYGVSLEPIIAPIYEWIEQKLSA